MPDRRRLPDHSDELFTGDQSNSSRDEQPQAEERVDLKAEFRIKAVWEQQNKESQVKSRACGQAT